MAETEKTFQQMSKMMMLMINMTMMFYMFQMISSVLGQITQAAGGAPSGGAPTEQVILSDDFNDNSLDPAKWETAFKNGWGGYTGSGTMTLQEINQHLELNYTDSARQYAAVIQKNGIVLSSHTIEIELGEIGTTYTTLKLGIFKNKGTAELPEVDAANEGYMVGWRYYAPNVMLAFGYRQAGTSVILRDDVLADTPPRRLKIQVKDGKIGLYVDNGAGYQLWAEETYRFAGQTMYVHIYGYTGGTAASGTHSADNFVLKQIA